MLNNEFWVCLHKSFTASSQTYFQRGATTDSSSSLFSAGLKMALKCVPQLESLWV